LVSVVAVGAAAELSIPLVTHRIRVLVCSIHKGGFHCEHFLLNAMVTIMISEGELWKPLVKIGKAL